MPNEIAQTEVMVPSQLCWVGYRRAIMQKSPKSWCKRTGLVMLMLGTISCCRRSISAASHMQLLIHAIEFVQASSVQVRRPVAESKPTSSCRSKTGIIMH